MEKGSKVYIVISLFCISLVVLFCGFLIYKNNSKSMNDALKFKTEYEVLNGQKNSTGGTYTKIDIPEDNPIIYKKPKEIVDVLKNETAIVYFGFPSNFVCRNILETLFQVASDKKVDKIYYVNIENIRDMYVFDGTVKPKETKKGTEAYYSILEFFGDKLGEYYVKDKNGNGFDAGVKRLGSPTIVAIKDGEIKDMFNIEEDRIYAPIDEKQKKEIYNLFEKLIESIQE